MPKAYQEKRNFTATPEPEFKRGDSGKGSLTFVVQKHSARQLHYDFRLEVDGVLKSWAVAKGPSDNTDNKRLAVMVEDHPLDYAGFEGVIQEGQYGAGQVIVWDRGTYSPDESGELLFDNRDRAQEEMRKGLTAGKISITLRGEKLKGSWTLVKMKSSENNWLLIKHRDDYANKQTDILVNDASVISGRTIEDLKSGRMPQPLNLDNQINPAKVEGSVKALFPQQIAPMLATLATAAFSDKDWLFEPKLDGYRTLAFVDNGKVRLQSRNENDFTAHYKNIVTELKSQPSTQIILDGEIIALDARGKQCFQCLQGYLKSINIPHQENVETPSAVIYYIFDILYLDGYDLKKVPLKSRKELLKNVFKPSGNVRLVEHFDTEGEKVYKAAVENGLEGMIAKKQDSVYEAGKRSKTWLKVKKVNSDEFVVAGYTHGIGNRAKTFGALILGFYDDKNILQYAGNVGTGFDADLLAKLKKQLDIISAKKSPFASDIKQAEAVWVKPQLVAEIKFAEWTQDDRLRAPVFLRLRDDKPAETVRPTGVIEMKTKSPTAHDSPKKSVNSDLLEQLASPANNLVLDVEGHQVSLTHLEKELWPKNDGKQALTKRELIKYMVQTAPYLLPHLKDRPLSLSRYPNGIYGEHFFQKHYQPVPEFVQTVSLSSHDTPLQEYLICNNTATLLWLGQIGDLELHTWFSRVTSGPDIKVVLKAKGSADYYANYPDFLIFDIDPYIYSGKEKSGDEPELNRKAFEKTCQVVLELKQILDNIGCPSFVKTSGKTGLHVFVPIMRELDFHGTHSAAETICKLLLQQHPDQVTVEWAVEKRAGKVFLDYNQNVRGKTLASIYSPRPSPQASVSMPLKWEELGKVYPTDFTILTVPERLAYIGDLWAGILEKKIDLVKLISGMDLDSRLADIKAKYPG